MITPTLTAEALLVRLDRLGIDAIPFGSELHLISRTDAGEEALTEELVIECRLVKPDLLEAARLRAQSEPTAWLLSRLRNGQAWLDDVLAELEAMPYGGLGTALNTRFIHGLDMWLRLEGTLRYALHFTGCIHGAGGRCPPDAVARCDACVSPVTDND